MDKAKNIIITGEEVDFKFEELKRMGVSVYHYPMISISKIDNQIDSNNYDYIIFTSKNGVKYFLENLSSKINSNLKFICIGNKTAQLLVENKLNPYFIVKRNYSQFMCEEIKGLNIDKKDKILLVQGNLAKKDLHKCLSKSYNTEQKIVYKTDAIQIKQNEIIKKLDDGPTYVVFTSPSTFDSFIDKYELNDNIISIGETTSNHINDKGYNPLITAKMQSYEGISNSIIDFLNKNLNYELS